MMPKAMGVEELHESAPPGPIIGHIGTNSMLVDPLTKGVSDSIFREHIAYMGLKSYADL